MWHYLSTQSRVMMSDGKYKDVKHLVPYDRIASFKTRQQIYAIESHVIKTNLVKLRTNNWYSPYYLLKSQRLLSKDGKLVDSESLRVEQEVSTPLKIGFDLPFDNSMTYDKGFVLGSFLVVGFYNDDNNFGLHFTSNDYHMKVFINSFYNAFPSYSYTKQNDRIYLDKGLSQLFKRLKPSNVTIYQNKTFIKGIYDGIIDNIDNNFHFKLDKHIYEIVLLCASILGFSSDTKIIEKQSYHDRMTDVIAIKIDDAFCPIIVNGSFTISI